MTDDIKQVYKKIEECEKSGQFDVHTTTPDLSLSLPVDEKFDYIKKGVKHFFPNCFVGTVGYFIERKIINKTFNLRIKGEENLKDINNSVVVCNHVHMFDCVIVRKVFKRKNLYITAAEFNNRGDFLGFLMRYLGMMPFSSNKTAVRNLNKAIDEILHSKKGHVLFFPEASEWLYYKKPRPFKDGAFHYAVKHNVPIQPMFITFEDTGRVDKNNNPTPDATIHILPVIYPRKDLGRKENSKYLRDTAYKAMEEKYESVYGQKLEYIKA